MGSPVSFIYPNSKSWNSSHTCDRVQPFVLEIAIVTCHRRVVFTQFWEEMGPPAPPGALTHTICFTNLKNASPRFLAIIKVEVSGFNPNF